MRHSNRKPPLSLNAGILAAAGKYITFIGSDDEYKPDHLELRMKLLSGNPGIDLIHGGIEIVGSPFVKDKNDLSRLIPISECIVGCTFIGKKEVFNELEGFRNLKYSDDSDFYERASGKYKIMKVDYPTYIYYRDTPDSICSTFE
jgi:glycosyltransferase involved in cell wall biosynthesis